MKENLPVMSLNIKCNKIQNFDGRSNSKEKIIIIPIMGRHVKMTLKNIQGTDKISP